MKIKALAALILAFPGAAALADDIRPGLWKISMESEVAATPDWKPQPFELTQCLTESDAKDPARLLLGMGSPEASSCDFPSKTYAGNSLSFEVNCAGTLGINGHGQVTFSPTSLDGFLDVNMDAGEAGRIEMRNKIHASYLGACPSAGGGS